eukprot:TRINITY_DN2483_c1_g1_i1.p1 TRINITY_DN2483_c1_g1~~TRINITY_DN2483_c1_g1_i1.p1  ORF type:complete len:445 (-),score=112.24 TRINITY_DN2483_c1_g1_i1:76-1410(-)
MKPVLLLPLLLLLLLECAAGDEFVRRCGTQLVFEGAPFRFSGCNMYWLGLDENCGGVDYPTRYRVDDAVSTAVEMGAQVVRAHTVGVSTGCSKSFEASLDTYNSVAADYIDYAVYAAGKAGLKLVIPLTDNYHYYHGGKHDFCDWLGVDEKVFFTDTKVIAAYLDYVDTLIMHVNNYTGLALRDDPAIMAWETGNELSPPATWTQTVADHIKAVDPNHLVMDGRYGVDDIDALRIASVDIHSDHYYPMSTSKLAKDAKLVASYNKTFFVGEYGWSQGDLAGFLEAVEEQVASNALCGDTYWSLFPHYDRFGFVQHNDGFTLHYPGDTEDMRDRVQKLRTHAYTMAGAAVVPPHATPATPLVTAASAKEGVAWRGAAAADYYTVERSVAGAAGPWDVACDRCATDNDTPWADVERSANVTVWYRVVGFNLDDVPGAYSDPFKSAP